MLTSGIDQAAFAAAGTELRDRLAALRLRLDVPDRSRDETAEPAVSVFDFRKRFAIDGLTRMTPPSATSLRSPI